MTNIRSNYFYIMAFLLTGALVYVIMMEPKYALFLSALLLAGIFFVKRPIVAIMIGLFLSFDLIPVREILPIRGGMKPVFMVILMLFVGVFILELRSSQKIYLPKTPLNMLILLFLALILFSVFIARYRFSVSVKDALKASCYWYSFSFYFFIVGTVKEKQQIKVLINFIIVLANIVALFAILQWISGSSIPILPGAFAVRQEAGVLRIIGVLTPIAIVWPIFFADIILNKLRLRKVLFYSFEFILFGLAFILQMTRAFWIAIIISLGIVFVAGIAYRKENRTLVAKVVAIFLFISYNIGLKKEVSEDTL